MKEELIVLEKTCKSAIGKCGFPGGGWAVNPYVGCAHACRYCYARFMKRFTGHGEEWGCFVDVRNNIAEVLEKQMKSGKYKGEQIYIGTVTEPYQPLEKKYGLMRGILKVLAKHNASVSILTKSALVLRDIDLLKQLKDVDINFTTNTLDEKWKKLVEPNSSSVEERLAAAKKLSDSGIGVVAMMGPYWPFFTEPDELFKKFKQAGISHVFTESFNTTGSNFAGVEEVLKEHYPEKLDEMKNILFNTRRFDSFYTDAEKKVKQASKKYNLPVTIFFGVGHAAKFK